MQIPKFIKITFFIVLFLAVAAYLVYTFFIMKPASKDEVCAEVMIMIDDDQYNFVDSMMVDEMIKKTDINPMGKRIKDIDLKEIERTVTANPFVTQTDCYASSNGMEVGKARICIKVIQRIPVVLVMEDSGEHYYVDAQGNLIEADSLYARNLLVASGDISHNYASSSIAQLAQFVRQDPFWDNQIEQVYVEMNKKQNRVVTLIPRVGDHKIFLGEIDEYEKKLARLRRFYEKGMPKVGWNKYSVLNLEFDNQVVGVVKGMEKVTNIPDEPTNNEQQANSNNENKTENNQTTTQTNEVKSQEQQNSTVTLSNTQNNENNQKKNEYGSNEGTSNRGD